MKTTLEPLNDKEIYPVARGNLGIAQQFIAESLSGVPSKE